SAPSPPVSAVSSPSPSDSSWECAVSWSSGPMMARTANTPPTLRSRSRISAPQPAARIRGRRTTGLCEPFSDCCRADVGPPAGRVEARSGRWGEPLPRSRGPVGWEGEAMGVAEGGRTSRDGTSEPQGGTTGAGNGPGAERRARGQVVEPVAGPGYAHANASPLVRGGRAGEGPSEASGRGERMGRRSGASGVPEPSIVALSGFSAVRTPITQRWNLGGARLGDGTSVVLG